MKNTAQPDHVAEDQHWVDFNGNGSWADAGEMIAAAYALSPGTNALAVAAPSGTFLGKTYARLRYP